MNPIFYLSIFFAFQTFAGPIHGGGASDPATYEAITGESADEDKSVWDSFYKVKKDSAGREPIDFLKEQIRSIPKGRAFVPAMGEGRNAIYLAKKGFVVEGNDLSETAVDRALETAKAEHVQLKAKVADLLKLNYSTETYDLVVVSLFYMDLLIPKFKKTLKHGGYILFYEKLDTGTPQKSVTPDDFLVKLGTIKTAIRDLDIIIFRQYKDQGVDVVGILARKP